MAAMRRGRRRAPRVGGAGFGVLSLGLGLTLLGLLALLDLAEAPLWVWLVPATAGLWWWAREGMRRQRERAAARSRARAQRLLLWGIGARRHAERPIDARSPLPRAWWEPVDLAHRAVKDYRSCVASLPRGPVRDRMRDGVAAMEAGAAELEALARRGAELDRQLQRFRAGGHWPSAVGADGRPRDQQRRIAQLHHRVRSARHRVGSRLEALRLAALEAADVAVSMSLADADDLVSSVEDTLTRVSGMASALDDADLAGGRGRAPSTQPAQRSGQAPPVAPRPQRRRG